MYLLSDSDLVGRQLYSVGPMSHLGECIAVNMVIVDTTLNVTHRRLLAVRMKYISQACNKTQINQINVVNCCCIVRL